jgi:nucleoside-diphosphate-sugar epimerase
MDRLEHQIPLSYKVNVTGTDTVIKACQDCHIKFLIQTSTSNVSVARHLCSFDMDEKTDYVTRENAPNHYGWTKAVAEQLVLKANGVAGVRTVSIRPCSGVFGTDDKNLLEAVIKLGRALVPPNGGANVIDFVSVMNVVWAHLLTEKALWEKADDGIAGENFCISNNNPMRLWDFLGIANALRPGGVVMMVTPFHLLNLLAYVIEWITSFGYKVPGELGLLTVATKEYLELSYAFNCKKAHQRLGYEPIFSMEQAIQYSIHEWQAGQMLPVLPSATQ